MKKIEAVIRPEKLEELRESLDKKGFSGMTVTEVKGRGTQKGVTLEWRVGEYKVEFLPKIKLEMVVLDKDVAEVFTTPEAVNKALRALIDAMPAKTRRSTAVRER